MVFYKSHALDLALEDYNQAVALAPDFETVYLNRFGALHDSGRLEETLEDLNKLLEFSKRPGSQIQGQFLSMVYFSRGRVYIDLGNDEQGQEDIAHAKRIFPEMYANP